MFAFLRQNACTSRFHSGDMLATEGERCASKCSDLLQSSAICTALENDADYGHRHGGPSKWTKYMHRVRSFSLKMPY